MSALAESSDLPALDRGDEAAGNVMMMMLVRAAVLLGQLDSIALDRIDGAEADSVGAENFHVGLDLAEIGHGASSPAGGEGSEL